MVADTFAVPSKVLLPRSMTNTRQPFSAKAKATAEPPIPAPITMVSQIVSRAVDSEIEGVMGALIKICHRAIHEQNSRARVFPSFSKSCRFSLSDVRKISHWPRRRRLSFWQILLAWYQQKRFSSLSSGWVSDRILCRLPTFHPETG